MTEADADPRAFLGLALVHEGGAGQTILAPVPTATEVCGTDSAGSSSGGNRPPRTACGVGYDVQGLDGAAAVWLEESP
jgi:hypothetical protein